MKLVFKVKTGEKEVLGKHDYMISSWSVTLETAVLD